MRKKLQWLPVSAPLFVMMLTCTNEPTSMSHENGLRRIFRQGGGHIVMNNDYY